MSDGNGKPLFGDRGAWDSEYDPTLHSKDISESALQIHLSYLADEYDIMMRVGGVWVPLSLAEAGIAPNDASYVTLGTSAGLTSERVLTGTANQITLTDNGAGSTVVLSLPQNIDTAANVQFATLTLNNTGLHILDTNASHDLIIAPGSDLTADHTLTITTGDADRTITLSGNPTLDDWFDQSVKTTAAPTFAGGTFNGAVLVDGSADAVQLTVQANATQTANLTEWQNSSGVLSGADSNGILFSYGNPVVTTSLVIGKAGNSTFTGTYNVMMGANAGHDLTSGASNVLVGGNAGANLTSSSRSFVLGYQSMYFLTSGANDNVAIGNEALRGLSGAQTNVDLNVGIGSGTMLNISTGARGNIAIGHQAGYLHTTGDFCIKLGYRAGYNQTTTSNLLIIDNQQRADAATELTNSILYGVMAATPASQTLRINAVTTVSQSAVIGVGAAGVDYTLTFDGETNDGVITWMEDEDYFQFADKVLLDDALYFTQTDGNEFIDSLADGYMDYGATALHRFNNPLTIANIKTGATQAAASAAAGELWATASHASLPDNVVMIGV